MNLESGDLILVVEVNIVFIDSHLYTDCWEEGDPKFHYKHSIFSYVVTSVLEVCL